MEDKCLDSDKADRNQETGKGRPEGPAQKSIVFAKDGEGCGTENGQIEGKAEPRDWNSTDGRELAVEDFLTARGDRTGNGFAALDPQIEGVNQSQKGEQQQDDPAGSHFSDLEAVVPS